MKIKSLFGLAVLLTALCATTGRSQSASGSTEKPTKERTTKRATRRMNTNANQRTAPDTSVQDARYRQTSVGNGTAVNNSNTTNYNSNNAVNNTTGAGANPNMPVPNGTPPNNNTGSAAGPATQGQTGASGTAAAVEDAKMTKTPAVDVGSTKRNSSVGDFIASSPNYTTLQNALQAVDLNETLRQDGAYTLFAPSNAAFQKLPTAVQGKLLDGANRNALKQLLLYHVVSGKVDAVELTRQIKSGNGEVVLKTLAGGTLTARLTGNGDVSLTDGQGQTIRVTGSNVVQTNGVVHELSDVLLPQGGASAFR